MVLNLRIIAIYIHCTYTPR